MSFKHIPTVSLSLPLIHAFNTLTYGTVAGFIAGIIPRKTKKKKILSLGYFTCFGFVFFLNSNLSKYLSN